VRDADARRLGGLADHGAGRLVAVFVALLVEADQRRQLDVEALGERAQRSEGRVDLAALERADVVAVQAGAEAELRARPCAVRGPESA